MLNVGEVLGGKYRIERMLGEGGMGQVFEAQHIHLGHRVAIKVLRTDILNDHTSFRRFLREAKACMRVGHPNIVRVYDLDMDETGTVPFIVEELLQGQSLSQALYAQPLKRFEAAEVLRIMVPIMGALEGAHQRGVVHRDVKPDNIFLGCAPGGVVVPKIIDFGVAKVRDDVNTTILTATGSVIGSPEYMSPEQVAGEKTVDAQTDVWSVGVVLYELLTGEIPFDSPNPQWVMVKILHDDPTPIQQWNKDISDDLASVIHRALQRDRTRRYRSMRAFVEALIATAKGTLDTDTLPDFSTTDTVFDGDNTVAGEPSEMSRRTPVLPITDPECSGLRSAMVEPKAPVASKRGPAARWQSPWWVLIIGAVFLAIAAALIGRSVGHSAL